MHDNKHASSTIERPWQSARPSERIPQDIIHRRAAVSQQLVFLAQVGAGAPSSPPPNDGMHKLTRECLRGGGGGANRNTPPFRRSRTSAIVHVQLACDRMLTHLPIVHFACTVQVEACDRRVCVVCAGQAAQAESHMEIYSRVLKGIDCVSMPAAIDSALANLLKDARGARGMSIAVCAHRRLFVSCSDIELLAHVAEVMPPHRCKQVCIYTCMQLYLCIL